MGSHLFTLVNTNPKSKDKDGLNTVKHQLKQLFDDDIIVKTDDCGVQFTHRSMIPGYTAYDYANVINGLIGIYCS